MSFAIFNWVGLMLVLKFVHVASGIMWIGSSFVMAKDSAKKSNFIFWAANLTLLTGLLHIAGNYSLSFYSSWGISMLLGSGLGILMWAHHVFGLIPAQKLNQTKRFDKFLYTNILLSIPMLFFMEAASHLGIEVNAESERLPVILGLVLPIVLVELYAVIDKGPQISNLKRASSSGVVLTIVLYLIFELTTK